MKTVEYYLLDVFTDQPFTGNPLAVFLEADGLPGITATRRLAVHYSSGC